MSTAPSTAEGFSAEWLAQREPFDARAREHAAERLRLLARLQAWRPTPPAPWRVIDLACGTGANLRWLAPRLSGAQEWLVVDHDAALLQRWPERLGLAPARKALHHPLKLDGPGFKATVQRQQVDLAANLEALPWHAAGLVTASALLDLVSEAWLQRLVRLAVDARVALLFTLSVDGEHAWTPRDPLDASVGARFAAHQRRDKGFGPALGAQAVPSLQAALLAHGYRVFTASSDWRVPGDGGAGSALMAALIEGMASAAAEQQPAHAAEVLAWRERRLAHAAHGAVRVGHVDLLALPR
ncbi:class I SAM-dependent methyltransferase [Hydrogenophaga palleronii]|uniref:class I SAM-dependent methyltransferase n=1 Tax=Hydrogenophaga palleronii TaxID=65655 RepID=UPI00082588AF|nr:class I SAM-dependent methyltransferase [Hydrogenophaga palleronii]